MIAVIVARYLLASFVVLATIDTLGGGGIVVAAQDKCTLCSKNSPPLTMMPPCDGLESSASGMFATDAACGDNQLLAWQKGCCPSPPFDHCEVCADGTDYDPDGVVPTGQFVDGYACFDYKAQKESYLGMFEDGTCDDTFLRRAGQYCGCPNQVQQCWLCPDRQPPTKPAKGDAWVTNSNCRGIEFLFSLFDETECSEFPFNAGADLSIFCGCNGLDEEAIEEQKEKYQCTLCEGGAAVNDPDATYTDLSDSFQKTCRQAEEFALDVIKTPGGCNSEAYFGKAREVCCGGSSGGPTAIPRAFAPVLLFLSSWVALLL